MKFWKLHGAGNDFVAIDGRFDNISSDSYNELAQKLCHRHFGIGADGLLVVKECENADVEMVYYNSDGSRANMCGNGLRCFCKFVYDNKIVKGNTFSVYTLDGVKYIELDVLDDEIQSITVNMGKPTFNSKSIPVDIDKEKFINEEITALDKTFTVSSVLMGVPHTIIFVEELDKDFVKKYGPKLEKHDIFPQNTNVNFVKVIDKDNIEVYTWERGCGYTLACGTGMTASAIISNLLGKASEYVSVKSEGGIVNIKICDDIFMIGNAVKICEGEV